MSQMGHKTSGSTDTTRAPPTSSAGEVEPSGCSSGFCLYFFFFQAEDGIRDSSVTGVQTCALPILPVAIEATELPRLCGSIVDDRPAKPGELGGLHGDGHFAGLKARKVEHAVDQDRKSVV